MSVEKFSRDDEMTLIELVSSYKCLYDASDKNYKDIIMKDNIWKEIAGHFENKNDDDCKKRWRSIRDSYKRIKREGKLGTGSAATKRNKWPLSNYLSFLENVSDERRTTTNILPGYESSDGSLIDTNNIPENHNIQEDDSNYDSVTSPSSVAGTSVGTSISKRSYKRKPLDDNITKLLDDNKKARDTIIEALLEKKSRVQQDDDVDMFYKSIAISVKRLPPHLVSEAKLQHLQIVTNLEKLARQDQNNSSVVQPRQSPVPGASFTTQSAHQHQLPSNGILDSENAFLFSL